jgi:uncharacterized RmlC-like cupin family protein
MRATALGICGLVAISLCAVASYAQQQKPGDVEYVPPGVPHYFSDIPDHVTEILVRWDVK